MADAALPARLLKLSGEALAGERGFGFDFDTMARVADEIADGGRAPAPRSAS